MNATTNSSSSALLHILLKPYKQRHDPAMGADAVVADLNVKLKAVRGAYVAIFGAPPIQGLGSLGGFKLQIEDRGSQGYDALYNATQAFIKAAQKAPELGPLFSTYSVNTPQLEVEVDRVKAAQLGVLVTDIFDTLQVYMGSLYVNDFNSFGRVYQVRAQADAQYRTKPADILALKTRSNNGKMIPLGSLLTIHETYGADLLTRYNGFTAADINGGPAPGYSSDQAQAAVERIAAETLPKGFTFEWTDLTYQQIIAGNSGADRPLARRAAGLPGVGRAVRKPAAADCDLDDRADGHPLGARRRMVDGRRQQYLHADRTDRVGRSGVEERHPDRRVRPGTGGAWRSVIDAAIEASRLRLRPILMTSIAFIAGVIPLIVSSGAGAEMRHAMGVAVFFGMLGVTVFGLAMTPVFYVALRALSGNRPLTHHGAVDAAEVTAPALSPEHTPVLEPQH